MFLVYNELLMNFKFALEFYKFPQNGKQPLKPFKGSNFAWFQ